MAFVIKYLTAVPRSLNDWPKWNLRGLAVYNIDIGFGIYREFHLRCTRHFLNHVLISVAKHVMLRYTAYMYIQGVWRNAIYFLCFHTICNNVIFFVFNRTLMISNVLQMTIKKIVISAKLVFTLNATISGYHPSGFPRNCPNF